MKVDRSKRLISKLKINSPVTEQFKLIRKGIEFAGIDNDYRVILVTSPEAKSGKSTISANIAITYAQKGSATLLIDADMRKPTVHQTFLKSNLKGLSTALVGETTLLDSIQITDIENLSVMSSGPIPPNPNKLLGSKKMAKVLDDLKKQYQIIIIDTPPIRFVSDALELAPYTDGVIIVNKSGVTKKEDMFQVLEQLRMSRSPVIGAILNNDKEKIEHQYYYSKKENY
ncbi:polysaccharide biosynthesis tyrosine autokinase [Lactobacillus curvatus]|nr:polysaccharide biosynthesis tyrosine autokinase [Latilactobacillus curvatus]MSE24063.1 polysaccharide biosynthesis tyrosine autokinase [Latilactobacillus curvatus]